MSWPRTCSSCEGTTVESFREKFVPLNQRLNQLIKQSAQRSRHRSAGADPNAQSHHHSGSGGWEGRPTLAARSGPNLTHPIPHHTGRGSRPVGEGSSALGLWRFREVGTIPPLLLEGPWALSLDPSFLYRLMMLGYFFIYSYSCIRIFLFNYLHLRIQITHIHTDTYSHTFVFTLACTHATIPLRQRATTLVGRHATDCHNNSDHDAFPLRPTNGPCFTSSQSHPHKDHKLLNKRC